MKRAGCEGNLGRGNNLLNQPLGRFLDNPIGTVFIWLVLQYSVADDRCNVLLFKRTLSPYFRNLPLLHITIRLHLIWRLLIFMQWLARKQYLLRRRTRQIRLNAVGRVKVGDNIIDL